MRRLGVMGGTFDPIHLGHLRAAENARDRLGLEQVLFVPAGVPPHRATPGAAVHHRFAMVALATVNTPSFVASDLEVLRQGPSYTVDTVSAVRESHPETEVVLIVGGDNAREVAGWKDRERLLSLCTLAVVTRPGVRAAGAPERALLVDGTGLEVSSTSVRAQARDGHDVTPLVGPAVADYIRKTGLYR